MSLSLSTFWNFYLASNMEVMMGLTRQGGFPLVDVRGQANLLSFPTTPPHPGPLFSFLFVFFIFFSQRNSNFHFNTQPLLSCCHNNAMNLLHVMLIKIKLMMIMRTIYHQTGNVLQDGLCSSGGCGCGAKWLAGCF